MKSNPLIKVHCAVIIQKWIKCNLSREDVNRSQKVTENFPVHSGKLTFQDRAQHIQKGKGK